MNNFSVLSHGRVSEQGRVGYTAWFEINDPALANGVAFVKSSDPAVGICPLARQNGKQYFLTNGSMSPVDLEYVIVKPYAGSLSAAGETVLRDNVGNFINPMGLSSGAFTAHGSSANDCHHSSFEGKIWQEYSQRHVYMSGAFFWVDPSDNRLKIEHRIFYFNPMSPVVPFPGSVFDGTVPAPREAHLSFDDRCVLTSLTR